MQSTLNNKSPGPSLARPSGQTTSSIVDEYMVGKKKAPKATKGKLLATTMS